MKALTYLLILLSLIIVSCESPTEPKDCAGVAGGTAVVDCAGTCDGTAVVDCAGTCDGAAVVDMCEVCDSDATNDCVQDCASAWGGTAVEDCAGICDGTTEVDCAGICDGTTTQEYCDACTAASGVFDCFGVCGGTAVVDCAGTCGGTAVLSGCDNVCNSTAVVDCAGTCGGSAVLSGCDNACNSTAVVDCNGICGGPAIVDCFGECDGTAVEDCAGVCDGTAVEDCAGLCDGPTTDEYCDACISKEFDCFGKCDETAVEDCAGVCDGTAVEDCAGTCDGTALVDMCEVCDSDATNDCVQDCASAWGGTAVEDCAGICDGTAVVDCAGTCGGTALLSGCDNVCNSTAVVDCAGTCDGSAVEDLCGICDGDAEENENCAGRYVNEGNEAFFNFMMNGPDNCPEYDEDEDGSASNMVQECLDMSDIDEKYNKALDIDSGHKGAIFGKAYMELFQISQDELLKTTIDQWENCFKHYKEEFDDEGLSRSIVNSNEFEMGFPNSGNAFYSFDVKRILNFIPIITSHEDLLLRNNDDCPEISSIQDVLEDVFLARISNTIERLDQVIGNDFVFTITPAMIEDPDGDKIEIDDTEIYLMKAFMHQIRAIIYAIITYDVNVPYYDIIDDIIEGEGYPTSNIDWSWLSTDSDLLTIRDDQEDSWPNAHADLNNVLNSIENAWNFLDTDTDTYYDAIQKDMVELECDDGDCPTVPEVIDEIRDILNSPYVIELDFRDCDWVCDNDGNCWDDCEENIVEITVDIEGFLTTPPQNLKEFLPTYSVTTATCEDRDHDHHNGNNYYSFSIQDSSIVENQYYSFNGNCRMDNDDDSLSVELWNSYSFDFIVENEMQTICADIISTYGNNVDYFNMSFYLSSNGGSSGQLTLEGGSNYSIETYETIEWGCPDITWEADTCEEWKDGWDYTLGGLFPYMTQDKFINDIVGEDIDEDDCEEILEGNLFDF